MEEIQTVYNNEEDETIKPKIKLNETTVNLAPDLNIKTQNIENNDNVKENNQISNDSEQFLFPDNTLNGNVKKFAMDDFTFEEKFHTFKNYGYSLDPTNMEKSKFIGDEKQFSDFGGSTVFRENPLKRKKYRRPKREKTGDPSDIDGFKGPWAKFEEDEEELAEMNAKQKRLKELFQQREKAKNKKSNEKKQPSEPDNKTNEKSEKTEDSNFKETTVFEYTEERDYLGRTYMFCPHEFRGEKNQRCFVPNKKIHTWTGHTDAVTKISWFPKTGHLLLSASMDNSVKIWDVNSHRRCLRTVTGHQMGIRDLSLNRDGTKFITVSFDQWIKLWDTETGKLISRFNSGAAPTCARIYAENENEFIASQKDNSIVGWDVRKNEIIQKYEQHLRPVLALTFIDNNKKFVSSSDDKKIYVWEYGIPVVVNHITEPYMNSVPYLTESPDGEWFLGQSMDNAVVVYSSADKRKYRKRQYIGHRSSGYNCQVDVSPDGQFILSGDSDGRAFIWDWKTKRIFKRLNAHQKVTVGAIWHPVHPSKIATCSYDGTIKYWD